MSRCCECGSIDADPDIGLCFSCFCLANPEPACIFATEKYFEEADKHMDEPLTNNKFNPWPIDKKEATMTDQFSEEDLRIAHTWFRYWGIGKMDGRLEHLAAEFAKLRRDGEIHAAALVAGAVGACAKICRDRQKYYDGLVSQNPADDFSLQRSTACEDCSASILQFYPAATGELERRLAEARLEARIDEWRDAVVYFLSADLHGNDIEKIKGYVKSHSADLNHQLTALSGKETSQ